MSDVWPMVKAAAARDRITCTITAALASSSGTTSEIVKPTPATSSCAMSGVWPTVKAAVVRDHITRTITVPRASSNGATTEIIKPMPGTSVDRILATMCMEDGRKRRIAKTEKCPDARKQRTRNLVSSSPCIRMCSRSTLQCCCAARQWKSLLGTQARSFLLAYSPCELRPEKRSWIKSPCYFADMDSRAASSSASPSSLMPVISDGEWEFVRACQLEISRRYEHGPWSDMDYAAWFASYNFGDISEWPLDVVVVNCEPREKCLLGSLRTAADLLHAEYVTGVPITVVVSVCWKAEMQVKGTPEDWNEHFFLSGVQHLQVELDDYQVKYGQNPDWFMECAENCIRTWKAMADALLTARIACREAGRDFNVLFHCFGGINRSPAALCAWLVQDKHCSAEDAVARVLEARPALGSWQRRDYVLLALYRLQDSR